jgi:LysR family transcriptional activator of nhaA
MGAEIADLYGVRPLGELPGLTERFYAISLERRIKHPTVVRLLDWAHDEIFT